MASAPSQPAVAHLILDIGGVILPSAMPHVIAELAELSGLSRQHLWRYFNRELFAPFWSGAITLEAFWADFSAYAGIPGRPARWHTEMTGSMLTPLPGLADVRRWAEAVPVGVLSNHRTEWILPVLARLGLDTLLDPVLISSATGLVKPDPRAFAQLTRLGPPPDRVLYVDDRPQAIRTAEQFGLATIQADDDGAWVARVAERLAEPR
jgi:HAD superfamily hydrolase (TIGR01509 family)